MSAEPQPGTLYLVATPIGNLEDITLRAARVLGAVDWIAAEDTRQTAKLLQHLQVCAKTLSYHQHNCRQRAPELLAKLADRQSVALVADAGTPGISDPGTELVSQCVAAGVPVVPLPGPTAAIAALVASGLPADRFVFEGFLPAKGSARRDRLAAIRSETRTVVLYESPHRLAQTLGDLQECLGGDRAIVLARELTKLHEEFWRGSVAGAIARTQERQPRGEYTLIVAGGTEETETWTEARIAGELAPLLRGGMSRSDASRYLAERAGLPRRQVYRVSLAGEALDRPFP